jgi:hypothetical protein
VNVLGLQFPGCEGFLIEIVEIAAIPRYARYAKTFSVAARRHVVGRVGLQLYGIGAPSFATWTIRTA